MSRRLRTSVPTIRSLRQPNIPDQSTVSQQDKKEKEKQKTNFDSRHRVTALKPLTPGDSVWLPDQQSTGQVITQDAPRSYNTETPSGQYRRNRHHIIPLPATESPVDNSVNIPPDNVSPTSETTAPTHDTDTVKTRSGRTVKPPDRLQISWTL